MNQELMQKAEAASAKIEPAELHGLVSGMAAAAPAEFSLPDFIALAGTDALQDQHSVEEFVAACLDDMYASELSFAPLVPDDDEALSIRLMCLADFCAGFLSGFGAGVGEGAVVRDLPEEVHEILRDFTSISGMDDQDEDDEQDENSFMELFEYARVASILAMTLMAETEAQQTDAAESADADGDES